MNPALQTGFLATCGRCGLRPDAGSDVSGRLLCIAVTYLQWSESRMQEVANLLTACISPGAVIDVLSTRLGLIPLRCVQVARFLKFADPRFGDMDFEVVGSGAESPLEAIVGPNRSLQSLRDVIEPLLRQSDTGGILAHLEDLQLPPLKLTSLQHFCCELRKKLTGLCSFRS